MSIQNSTTYDYILTRGNSTNFASLPAVDGKIRFVIDKEELYVDYGNKHIRVSDIVIDYTEQQIRALTNFSNSKIYIASDNKKMLMYNDILGAWEDIMTKHTHPLSQITDAGTAAAYNVPESGDAGNNQVVLGSDSRLINELVNGYYNATNDKFYKEPTYITEIPGEANKIYIDFNYNRIYRWTGTGFIPLSATSDLELGTSHDNAYYGDYGNIAYEHATENARYTTSTAVGLYKVGSTEEGHISGLTAIEKADITGLGIPAQDTTYDVVTQSVDGLMSAADKEKLDNIDIVSVNIDATNHVLHLNGDDLVGLEGKVDKTSVGVANGVASLDSTGKVPTSQLPSDIGSLSGLSDVTITSPTNGQVLTYDTSNSVWINSNASGGSGGHTIENSSGTDMTQRTNLQFIDANITDDSTNDRTKVENVQVISSESDLTSAPDGIYIGSYDESSSVLSASIVSYDNTTSGLISTNVQTAIDEVKEKVDTLSSAYHHAGTKTCAELINTLLVASNEGNVYNISDSGETTSDFIEGAGQPIRIGDNVGVAKVGDNTYKFDLLSGFIDTSNFVSKSSTSGLIKNDGTIDTNTYQQTESGKGLSTNDYDNTDKAKVDMIDNTTTSATGNPISIADLKSAQIALNPVITYNPIQDLHGQSKPYPAGGGKNKYGSGDVSGTQNATVNLSIPAGTYTISAVCTSSDTDASTCLALVRYTDTTYHAGVQLQRTNRSSATFVLAKQAASITFYASDTNAHSSGDTFTVKSIQIEEGIQATDYAPYSNICPISGYDKIEVLSCGKNLFDGTYSVTNAFLQSDNNEYPSNNWNISQYIPVKANAAYYFSNLSGATSACICWYNQAKEFISATSITDGFTATSPTNAFYVRASVRNDRTNVCINEGGSAITYEPYHKTTDLSESLGQTVYGGSLDVRTGKLKNKLGYMKLTADLVSGYDGNYLGWFQSVIPNIDYMKRTDDLYCSHAVARGTNEAGSLRLEPAYAVLYLIIGSAQGADTVDAFKTYLTNNDVYIAYPLLESAQTEIQLTPHEISLLKDYAYVSTNGTNIALDYHNGELASLADVSQLGETVNEGLDCLKAYVEKNVAGNYVTLTDTKYEFPCDGYVVVASETSASGVIRAVVQDKNNTNVAYLYMNVTSAYQMQSVFVRKGLTVKVIYNTVSAGWARFIPLP